MATPVVKQALTASEDLVITRIFDAPLDQVWRAWTEPQQIMRWWGPNGFTSSLVAGDFREGGTALLCMSAPRFGEFYSTWHFRRIVPGQRIEYIHNLSDAEGVKADPQRLGMPADFPQDQLHIITFTPRGENQTELTVTETGRTPGQLRDLSVRGVNECLDKMAALLHG